jgi:multiple sugar transport system permease protein
MEHHLMATISPVTIRTRRTRRTRRDTDERDRGILSVFDWQRPSVRAAMGFVHVFLFGGLVFAGLGPIVWLAKSAFTPTQDTISTPLSFFPNGASLDSVVRAWTEIHIDQYFLNTVILAAGSWFVQLLVATTAGYVLSVLRPKYAFVLNGLVLATLFIPSIVLLVPLYLTILNPPIIGESLLNNYLAVWLPAGANAFNILLVKRFFDNLPREVFEAARTDGAGPFRLFVSIVLPMSKPIFGVVSVFAIIASWKDYLWPMLVIPKPALQPLSVRLPSMQNTIELDVFLAALAVSTIIPIVLFLAFQRVFLRSAGLGGAVKG